MKIAMLLDKIIYNQVINPKTEKKLSDLAVLSFNETRENAPETVKAVLRDADFAITSWGCPKLTADILDEAPNLRLIAHAAGSVKGFVTDELYDRGIKVVSSAKILSTGVSETALGLTIASAKNFFLLNDEIRSGGWSHTGITELYDITIGIVGFGFAGLHYAELLRAFEVEVIAYDPGVRGQKGGA